MFLILNFCSNKLTILPSNMHKNSAATLQKLQTTLDQLCSTAIIIVITLPEFKILLLKYLNLQSIETQHNWCKMVRVECWEPICSKSLNTHLGTSNELADIEILLAQNYCQLCCKYLWLVVKLSWMWPINKNHESLSGNWRA